MRWIVLAILVAGCGASYIKGTQIEATPEREAIAELVEKYRSALEKRDTDTIREMVSAGYYENGSTTEDPTDDYDSAGLDKVLAELKSTVKAVRYQIDMTAINVTEDVATVDFDYRSEYLYSVGEQDRWQTSTDRNRLTFRRERGQWRIVSGM